jgi:hypothetical protein
MPNLNDDFKNQNQSTKADADKTRETDQAEWDDLEKEKKKKKAQPNFFENVFDRIQRFSDRVNQFIDRTHKRVLQFFDNWIEGTKNMRKNSNAFFDRMIERNEGRIKRMQERLTRMAERVRRFNESLQRFEDKVLGRKTKNTEQAEIKVEDEPLKTEQTEIKAEEEPIQQPVQPEAEKEKTLEEIMKTNPIKQTAPEFERYLKALSAQKDGKPVEKALESGEAKDYYEAVAQEMEASVADKILASAPDEAKPAEREAFMKKQKPIVASMTAKLRPLLQKGSNSNLINSYFAARDGEAPSADLDTMKKKLQTAAATMANSGVNSYLQSAQKQNEATKQKTPPTTQVQMKLQVKKEQGGHTM